MDRSLFDGRTKLIFEGYEFLAPAKYDQILKHIYGQYMELPPVEKRITHHDFQAQWTSEK